MVSGLIVVAVSDVPGPNSYNVNPGLLPQSPAVAHHTQCYITDSQLDSYKHGAFLENADRFTEAKPSDIPGEPQCSCHPPHPASPDTLLKDRARIRNLIMELPINSLRSASWALPTNDILSCNVNWRNSNVCMLKVAGLYVPLSKCCLTSTS